MDSEQRFIYALLASNRNEQGTFYAQQIPRGIFKIREPEIDWLYRFRERHGKYPSVNLYNSHFRTDKLKRHSDTVTATLQPVLDMAMFTQMRDLTAKTKEKIDKNADMSEAMAFFKEGANRLSSFSNSYVDIAFENSKNTLRAYSKLVRDIAEGTSLLDTPWPSLNKMVKFFMGGETVVVAARLSLGKTWYTIEWCDYYCEKNIPCLYFTKEMTGEAVSRRFESKRYKLPFGYLKEGVLSPGKLRRWKDARRADALNKKPYPLIICGDETVEGVGVEHITSKILQYKPRVAFIDGAYLIQPKGLSFNAKQNEKYAFLSNRFKSVAKATNTLIIIVIQMNRQAEKRDGTTKGTIGDLYGSDAWAQDADGVMDISGKRGSNRRTISWLKGRESAIGEFNASFILDPYPKLSETTGGKITSQDDKVGKVNFKGID